VRLRKGKKSAPGELAELLAGDKVGEVVSESGDGPRLLEVRFLGETLGCTMSGLPESDVENAQGAPVPGAARGIPSGVSILARLSEDGDQITVTVSGPVGVGKSGLLRLIHGTLSGTGMSSVFEEVEEARDAEDGILPSARTSVLLTARNVPLREAAEDSRRSLTVEEAGRLKINRDKLECSTGFVPGKGYICWTHRACSKYYPKPEAIPRSVLEFIGSTG
jgi:hypothetical protein